MRLLPFPPKLDATQSPVSRGLAILQFILDHNVTATCSDLDLELAQHVGPRIVADWTADSPLALERIQSARMLVSQTLERRRKLAETLATCADVPVFEIPNARESKDGGPPVLAVRRPQPMLPNGGAEVEF